jgi:hypothetical protein
MPHTVMTFVAQVKPEKKEDSAGCTIVMRRQPRLKSNFHLDATGSKLNH